MSIVYYRIPVKLKEFLLFIIIIFFIYKDGNKINYAL